MSADLAPGFMVIQGNHPEALRDLVLAWLARHPLAPLEDEHILVQSNGVAQWLRLALAGDVAPDGTGGCGVAAALQMQLPSRFLWQAYRAVLGASAVPLASPFDEDVLVWRLMRLLPGLLREDVFAPLRRFLERDEGQRKRHQLAERLADLLDQYQVYRADWLEAWADGRDTITTRRNPRPEPVPDALRWQPRLWRALLADAGPAASAGSRAEVHRRFLAAAETGTAAEPGKLPRRLVVFGISSLPQQSLEALAALSRWCQVLMCVHNPCEHDWSHIVADKDLLRAGRLRQRRRPGGEGDIPPDALHQHAQPLLAAWGQQGRDFIRLLDAHDDRAGYEQRFAAIGQRIDHFSPNAGATLLQQLQDDIRDLRPLAETRARWPAVDAARDRSIRFHVAHGAQREVEILHDQLLAAFAADASLRPRDVVVMVPDIAVYAPHVQAVFGLLDRDDPRHLPFTIADQGLRHHDALLGAVEKLLGLPESRIAVTDVLDLLDVPAVRARFDIADDQLPLLRRWIGAAGIRWGLDPAQRSSLGLPGGLAQNTWVAGLRRMLLGYAVGAGPAWEDVVPMDEIGGLDAVLLGPLMRLVEALEVHWKALCEPATPAAWGTRLRALLDAFLRVDEGADGYTLLKLQAGLQQWQDACADAGMDEPLPLSVVREHWLARMDQGTLGSTFLAGAVTFATLMPMRAIPFRLVALLGMNDVDYPRSRPPMDFDLMARDYRPGDRSRREDDRYLFLEALLSARERLHVSWIGRGIRDNQQRPASVLVAQLREHLACGWRLAGAADGAGLLDALTVEHRLQPFDAAYFANTVDSPVEGAAGDRLFSYATEWHAGASAARLSATGVEPLPALARDEPLTVRLLADFLKDPVATFFRRRLRIHFAERETAQADHEPFALDALENWQLQAELIAAQKAALEAGEPRAQALARQLERVALRGDLPVGAFGAAVQQELVAPMEDLFERYAEQLAAWPQVLPDEALDFAPADPDLAGDASLRLEDWLGAMRRNAQHQRGRLLMDSSGLVKNGRYRRDKLLPYWVAHLAGHVMGAPLTTVIVSKAGTITWPPLEVDVARARWSALLRAWRAGATRPLPLAVASAFAWLEQRATDTADEAAASAARACYEGADGELGAPGERDRNAYLARAFPDFDTLAASGEFAQLAETLLRPPMDALGKPAKAAKPAAGEST